MKITEQVVLWLAIATCLALRLSHLGGPLDEPMWRQTDTAYMAVRMMNESPPDLLRPKAPYRGTNDVKAAEFPIYPALASLAYKLAGRECLPAARLITLLFFAGSAWLLFLSVRIMAGARVAAWSTVLYTAAPLGIAYSRMVHPDFAIIFFSHLFLFGLLRFVQSGGVGWWSVGVIGGVAAFLMKAPYCFYLGLLPGWWWLVDREKRTFGRFIGLATVLILPLLSALWFNQHRIALEAPFEESLVYPMKWTAESSAGYFFGQLADRLNPAGWRLIAKRVFWLILTPAGLALALVGLVPWHKRNADFPGSGYAMMWVWGGGVLMYVLVIFPMVTGGHEYYSIPLIAPASVVAALGVVRVLEWCERRWPRASVCAVAVLLILLAAGAREGLARGPYLTKGPYFTVDWQRLAAGHGIREHTPSEALVLSVTHGRGTGWSDPRILYTADRRGWAIEARQLTELNLAQFINAGASIAAVLVTPEAEGREDELGPLAGKAHDVVPLQRNGAGLGSLRLYSLMAEPGVVP
ncbi:MAG TPA: glycosyltransferase family 39 protein [Kiritimatiellia bacterium]|nr:glycosyltransferase family 39 protein [Kiritimatiellia bacterium]